MIGILKNEDACALSLMERVLRDGGSLSEEFPLVFQEDAPGRVVAIGADGGVRSACAVLVRDFVVAGATVRGGMIGSVTTDPAWRDQGLAARLLVEAEAALQVEGCVFSVLWADDPAFYVRLGYAPIGSEEDYLVASDLAPRLPEVAGVRALDLSTHHDARDIHALYSAHAARVERSLEETGKLLRCPEMDTLVVERDRRVVGYACRGRGADFKDTLHEWGGKTKDVLGLVRAHLERRFGAGGEGSLALITPPGAIDLRTRLGELGAPSVHGILGLGKLLDRHAAASLLDERVRPLGSAKVGVTEHGDSQIFLAGPSREGFIDDDGALALLFGAQGVRDSVRVFLEDFGLGDARLPFEPFAWGLDSI